MPSQIFTSNGQFTVPSTVNSIIVECWGGGGAGGSATGKGVSTRSMGGGGAGGAYAKKTISVTPGQTFAVTVGKSQTSSGQQGNPSWFGTISTVYAEGGGGGQNGIAGTNIKYGTGSLGSSANSIGDIVARGGNGGYSYLIECTNGNVAFDSGAGGGAGGRLGRGGDATNSLKPAGGCIVYYANTSVGGGKGFTMDGGPGFGAGEYSGDGARPTEEGDGFNNPCNGKNGENYGGGGSGAVKSKISFGTCPGGAGAQGLIIVTWEINPICICFYTSGSSCCPPQIGCTAYGDPGFTTIAEPGYYYDGTRCWIVNDSGIIVVTGSCGGTTTSTTTTTTTAFPTDYFYTAIQYSCPSCNEVGEVTVRSSTELDNDTHYSINLGSTYFITGPTFGPSYDVDLDGAISGPSCFALCIT
jgi:hypothetical protein